MIAHDATTRACPASDETVGEDEDVRRHGVARRHAGMSSFARTRTKGRLLRSCPCVRPPVHIYAVHLARAPRLARTMQRKCWLCGRPHVGCTHAHALVGCAQLRLSFVPRPQAPGGEARKKPTCKVLHCVSVLLCTFACGLIVACAHPATRTHGSCGTSRASCEP